LLLQDLSRLLDLRLQQDCSHIRIEKDQLLRQSASVLAIDPILEVADDEQGVVNLLASLLNIVIALRLGGPLQVAGKSIVEGDQQAKAA
jgi:hypothetical protein